MFTHSEDQVTSNPHAEYVRHQQKTKTERRERTRTSKKGRYHPIDLTRKIEPGTLVLQLQYVAQPFLVPSHPIHLSRASIPKLPAQEWKRKPASNLSAVRSADCATCICLTFLGLGSVDQIVHLPQNHGSRD